MSRLPSRGASEAKKTKSTIRILIADDHPIFRTGLRTVLNASRGFQLVGEAADGAEAVKLANELKPDVLLLDLIMPTISGLEVLRQLMNVRGSYRTILISSAFEKEEILSAIRLGARGVVLKDVPEEVLIACIRAVMANQFWIEREGVSDLVEAIRAFDSNSGRAEDIKRFGLTPRELQLVAKILSGFANKDIAHEFSISQETVKRHLSNIFNKLGVSNRLELAIFALHHQLGPRELTPSPTTPA